jgi:putative ABC transport system permease protein
MILQSFRMAIGSIMASKLRSFLTMLGIIIGVVAVVVLISLVNGATSSVTSEIEGLGSNLLSVNIRTTRYQALTAADIAALAQDVPGIGATAPSLSQPATANNGSKTYSATLQGTTPDYAAIGRLTVQYGRFLKSPDLQDETAVAVVGATVADELFGSRTILGEKITIGGRSFLIVGVLAEGASMFGGADEKIIIPFTLAQRIYGQRDVRSFFAMADSSNTVTAAEDGLRTVLMARFRQDDNAFTILNQASILDVMASITSTLSLLLGGIAGISLLVGGIGIMNIMLVSVTERTREIGIRKAIGAGRRRIMLQFLIESMVISLLGGLIGILLSWGILGIVSVIAGINFAMTAGVITLAVGFSVLVGVIFGLYPANKAAKLQPIQALRTE